MSPRPALPAEVAQIPLPHRLPPENPMLPSAYSADTRIELLRLRLRPPSDAAPSRVRITGTARGFGWRIRVEDESGGTFFTNYQACCAGRLTDRELFRVIESARLGEHGPHLLEAILRQARTSADGIGVESRTHPETAAFVCELVAAEAAKHAGGGNGAPGSAADGARPNDAGREIAVDFAD